MDNRETVLTSKSVAIKGTTIFIAGVYGTGKSTMCSVLSEKLHIPAFSAGDLISAINGERYGAILNIFCGLDIVFLQELLNDAAFPVCHLYSVD